ncbi:MAG: UDP-3-O-(3-hydroxymyristoyl)glucosamine N-acyltransferase [Nitrospinae bacterium]|nr:UDP-3-O-(3-hydroxymyristoyl)glucosamine N-acyltransferase [Nitrospinota bacterium]
MRLDELAQAIGGFVIGDPHTEVTKCASLENAHKGSITYLEDTKYLPRLTRCLASAVIVPPNVRPTGLSAIEVERPALAFAKVMDILHPHKHPVPEVNHLASVHPWAKLGTNCHIGASVSIGAKAVIGDGCVLHPCAVIGENVFIGEGSVIHSNVTIYPGSIIGKRVILHAGCVIGADGFKYVNDERETRVKVRHLGIVRIGDDVEIGANSCVDRAVLDETVVGNGVKLDNLVQIGHNCHIGDHTVIAGSCGIGGSVRIGKHCVLGGQVGVADHVKITDNVVLAGKSGVTGDIEIPGIYAGFPAMPIADWRKQTAAVSRGPETLKRIAKMEKRETE